MKSIELFAGIGGIALAAKWAGIETIAFCERDPFCQKVLNKHWPNIPIFDDIRTLNRQLLEEKGVIEPNGTVDIISGGFPCQPFSIAGNKRGKEDDRDLWPEMFRIIKELQPRWIVGENVANFVNMELDRTLFDLESIGYRWRTFVIPACAVNAQHRRDRVFVVAYSDSIRCNEQEGFKEEIQQSGFKELQREESEQSLLSEPVHSFNDVTDSNSEHVEGSIKEEIQRERTLQRFLSPRSFEDIRRESEIYQPKLCRTFNGIPNQVDRLRSLGNAVVPQQIYPIFEAIMKLS